MLTIEIGIQQPETTRKGPTPYYPFLKMNIGDSFYVVGKDAFARARKAASITHVRHGMAFSCRKEGDGGRIWRVE